MASKNVKLYAISTCGWCRKTVNWLNENGVEYDLVYIDQLSGDSREQILNEVAKYNERRSFPTLVAREGQCVIVGFRPEEMEKELKA